jgi:uncharacterized coiled-coil protein SlyX
MKLEDMLSEITENSLEVDKLREKLSQLYERLSIKSESSNESTANEEQ